MIDALADVSQPAALTELLAQAGRGGMNLLAVTAGSGSYMSIFKILGMLVLLVPWACAAPWVHKDSEHVRAPKGLWGSVMLGVGAGAFLIWMLVPLYLAGLLLYVVAVAFVLISYLAYRNGRVPEEQKIRLSTLLQPKHKRPHVKVMTKLKVYGPNNQAVIPPGEEGGDDASVVAYNLTQGLLYDILWHRASEADLAPAGQQGRVRFVIDGVATERPSMSLGESETIIQYLKGIAMMNVEERRRPQKGQITVDIAGSPIEIDLTVAGKTTGQHTHFRIVQEFVQTKLDMLGISGDLLKRLRTLNQAKRGLFIVSGRPGSGVTSTLYSLLREQDAFIKQLATLESRVDIDLENITQHAYGEASDLSEALASVLRRDPDVVMVDRCKDAEGAQRICAAAQEKFILLGVQAPDSFTALAKWVKVCGDPKAAMQSLIGCMCQILIRSLCPTCREPYKPDSQLLAKANIPADRIDVFFRPPTKQLVDEKGRPYTCHACQGSGYVGRTAAFELLDITKELRQLIVSGGSLSQIKAAARKNRMLYLQEQALRKVMAGETSVQEVIRVSQHKK